MMLPGMTKVEILQQVLGLMFLLPIRLPLSLATVVISWGLAGVATWGIPEEELGLAPLAGWRKLVTRGVSRFLGTVLLACMGIR